MDAYKQIANKLEVLDRQVERLKVLEGGGHGLLSANRFAKNITHETWTSFLRMNMPNKQLGLLQIQITFYSSAVRGYAAESAIYLGVFRNYGGIASASVVQLGLADSGSQNVNFSDVNNSSVRIVVNQPNSYLDIQAYCEQSGTYGGNPLIDYCVQAMINYEPNFVYLI